MTSTAFNTEIWSHKASLENFALQFTKNNDDADDLVQDTMLKAIRYAQSYKDGTNLRGWLYTIMKNTFINTYRVSTIKNSVIETHEDLQPYHMLRSSDGNLGENHFVNDDIHQALKKLTPEYYTPFIKYFEGFKYHEIAKELCIPIGTVKTRIHLARQVLKSNLTAYSEQYKKSYKVKAVN